MGRIVESKEEKSGGSRKITEGVAIKGENRNT